MDVAVARGLGGNARRRKAGWPDAEGLARRGLAWHTVAMREETATRPIGLAGDRECAVTLPDADMAAPLPSVSLLALQFLAWVAAKPRTRAEVMDAWRSTCPRQSVWEDTVIDGMVRIDTDTSAVVLTPLGDAVLAAATATSHGRT